MRAEDIRIGMKVRIVDADLSQGHKPNGTILEVEAKHYDGIDAHILSDNKVYLNKRFEAITIKVGDFVKITGRSITGGEQCIGQTLKVKEVTSDGTVWVDTKEWANMYEVAHYEVIQGAAFKVGDTVKIIGQSWLGNTCDIGKIGVIYRIDSDVRYALKSNDDSSLGVYLADSLELIKSESIEMSCDKTELRTAYVVMQKNCGIDVGDCVKVLRTAKDCELGWGNSWTYDMNEQLNRTLEVESIGDNGIHLSDGYSYPFFVLEVVKKAEKLVDVTVGDKTFEVTREDADDIIEYYCDDCEDDDDDCDCDDDDF